MSAYRLYTSSTSNVFICELSEEEVGSVRNAYQFLSNYEKIEQKYAVILNNHLDLETDMVKGLHLVRNSPKSDILMYTNCELNRRLFNLLSAQYGYHEFMKELKADDIPMVSTFDFVPFFRDRRLVSPELALSWDMRHYYNHYGFPANGINWQMGLVEQVDLAKSPALHSVQMTIDPRTLTKKFSWSKITREKYLDAGSKFDVLPLVNIAVAEWNKIHAAVRKHFSGVLNDARKSISTLMALSPKPDPSALMPIAKPEAVQSIGENAFFEEPLYLHRQFIDRVDYYLNNFSVTANPNGMFKILAPRDLINPRRPPP
jgi:hypothetical protein